MKATATAIAISIAIAAAWTVTTTDTAAAPTHTEPPAIEYRTTPDLAALDATLADLFYLASIVEPEPVYQPPTPPTNYDPGDGSRWDQLAQCETGGNWATNTGNGYGGGLQFAHTSQWSTWLSFGGGEYAPNPWDATREQQIAVAERVLASSGWGAWPGCSHKHGWM